MDVHDSVTRSRNMAAIRSRDTKPELLIRSELFKRGYRFRLNDKKLPGKPDIVLKKYNATIFVNGCFWHGHNCDLFKWPKTRKEFWREKISTNKKRDKMVLQELLDSGWRVLLIWECTLKGKNKIDKNILIQRVSKWIKSNNALSEICGKKSK